MPKVRALVGLPERHVYVPEGKSVCRQREEANILMHIPLYLCPSGTFSRMAHKIRKGYESMKNLTMRKGLNVGSGSEDKLLCKKKLNNELALSF